MNIKTEGQVPQKADEILISRNLVSQFGKSPIGESLGYYGKKNFTITGIIEDYTDYVYADRYGVANYGTVQFFINEAKEGYYCYVKCYPGKVEEVQAWIEQKLQEVLPTSIEIKISTLQKEIENNQALENKLKGIILCFSIVCLIITLLGVYSAITLDTERRQKEVAIRKVNGAGLKEIIALFARLYIWLLGISAIFAFPIVFVILQLWKQMYLVFFNYGILYWGGILLGVTGITALTVIFRILKIARINPAKIIKSE
jgi:ABC-type antimicrobial peptide transport system permease subunit